MKNRFSTRRDMCHFVGKRAGMLRADQAMHAWFALASRVEAMGELDVPKFLGLLAAVRAATIIGFQMARQERRIVDNQGTTGAHVLTTPARTETPDGENGLHEH